MASECDAAGMPTNSRRMTLDFSEETSQISATIVGTARLIQIFNGNSASDAILPDTETCDKEHQDSPNAPYLSRTNDLSGSHSKTKESISSDDTMQAVSPHSSKYTCSRNLGGFGDMDMFYGGLDKLLGHPSPDLTLQLFVEHNEQRRKGFGCSTEEFIARNYEVATTPQKEYEFVVVADTTAPGGVLPERIPTKIEVYMQESVERMNRCGLHVCHIIWIHNCMYISSRSVGTLFCFTVKDRFLPVIFLTHAGHPRRFGRVRITKGRTDRLAALYWADVFLVQCSVKK